MNNPDRAPKDAGWLARATSHRTPVFLALGWVPGNTRLLVLGSLVALTDGQGLGSSAHAAGAYLS